MRAACINLAKVAPGLPQLPEENKHPLPSSDPVLGVLGGDAGIHTQPGAGVWQRGMDALGSWGSGIFTTLCGNLCCVHHLSHPSRLGICAQQVVIPQVTPSSPAHRKQQGWTPHPWKCSRRDWMGLGAPRDSGSCPCPWQEVALGGLSGPFQSTL